MKIAVDLILVVAGATEILKVAQCVWKGPPCSHEINMVKSVREPRMFHFLSKQYILPKCTLVRFLKEVSHSIVVITYDLLYAATIFR